MKHTVHLHREVRCAVAGKMLEAAAVAALEQARAAPSELTIVLTDDRRIRRLNARFAGEDRVTDVLAFPASTPRKGGYLGDVVIGLPRVRKQAGLRRVPLTHELGLLVVHGTLHLVGDDHHSSAERKRMWRRQSAALRRIGLDPVRLGVDR